MTDPNEIKQTPLPGLEVVGHGIHLRPNHPYELKRILFQRAKHSETYYSEETGKEYSIPEGYAINNSPPLPTDQAHNRVVIDESWERFDKRLGLDTQLAVGTSLFTINASMNVARQLHSEENSYYASRNSFIPLWTAYLANPHKLVDPEIEKAEIPVPFKHAHRRAYEHFFSLYGSHYVKSAWVGGSAMLVFRVAKQSQLSKRDIQAGIKASFSGQGGGVNASAQRSQEMLQSFSDCTVFGKGGDELALAALSTLDEARYNEWLSSIKLNPQVISLEVAGIWTLIHDPAKAQALMDAYAAATTFAPLTAITDIDKRVYMLRGNKYICYDIEEKMNSKPAPLDERWGILQSVGFKRIDAAFRGADLVASNGQSLERKLYFFRRDRYVRIDADSGTIDEGYPRSIRDGWPRMPFERIDAVLNAGPTSLYFFNGDQYVRFNMDENRVDDGYPQLISERWPGVTFDRIDAAIYWGNGKVYFFSGRNYIRFDMVTYQSDPGYPKFITGNYVEDLEIFD